MECVSTSSARTVRGLLPVRLRYVAGLFGGGIILSALHNATGIGVPCPFLILTGWQCPFCGGTRMGGALLRGDLAAAFAFNPVALVGLVVVGLVGLAWTVEALGGPALVWPRPLADRLSEVRPRTWLILGSAVAVGYILLRNLG